MRYTTLDNGIIVRSDCIDYDGIITYVDSYGGKTRAGTYYVELWDEMVFLQSGSDSDYNYDDDGNLLSIEKIAFESYYMNIDDKHLIVFFSNAMPSDNSGKAPMVFEGENNYVVYFTPEELTEEYKITYGSSTIVPLWDLEAISDEEDAQDREPSETTEKVGILSDSIGK